MEEMLREMLGKMIQLVEILQCTTDVSTQNERFPMWEVGLIET